MVKRNILIQCPDSTGFLLTMLFNEPKELEEIGLSSVLLFGMPLLKDDKGSMAYNKDGVVQQVMRKLKQKQISL